MENIVQFPTKSVRDWSLIERSMHESLASLNVPEPAHQRLVKVMKTFWHETLDMKFSFSATITHAGTVEADEFSSILSNVGEQISKLSTDQLQSFTNKLFFERLHREVEFCRELGLI